MRSFIIGFMLTRRLAGVLLILMLMRIAIQSVSDWRDLRDRSPNPRLSLISDLVFAASMAGFWWLISTDLFSPRVARFDLAVLIASAGYAGVLFTAAASVAPIYAPGNLQLQRSLKRTAVGFWMISIAAFTVVRWLAH